MGVGFGTSPSCLHILCVWQNLCEPALVYMAKDSLRAHFVYWCAKDKQRRRLFDNRISAGSNLSLTARLLYPFQVVVLGRPQ